MNAAPLALVLAALLAAPQQPPRPVTWSLVLDTTAGPREWMQRNRYDMPVLVDSGYASRADVHAFPTTWFLDRQARVAFVTQGWSEELAEEFQWRVELLIGPRDTP